jgi:hypothetical protein
MDSRYAPRRSKLSDYASTVALAFVGSAFALVCFGMVSRFFLNALLLGWVAAGRLMGPLDILGRFF